MKKNIRDGGIKRSVNSYGGSLGITIPQEIAKILEIEKGDEISWHLKIYDGRINIVVEKAL